jgi:hypothetical protein
MGVCRKDEVSEVHLGLFLSADFYFMSAFHCLEKGKGQCLRKLANYHKWVVSNHINFYYIIYSASQSTYIYIYSTTVYVPSSELGLP